MFKHVRSVRQRDPISPKLFTSLLEDIFRSMNWGGKYGVSLDVSRLSNLRFSDDIVLFARNQATCKPCFKPSATLAEKQD